MKRIFIAMMAAVSLAGCTQADIQANEDKAKAILAAIKSGARVAASVVKEGIDAVCANGATVNATANGVRFGFNTQSGPNTTQNLNNLDTALATLNSVCARAAANPDDPAIKSLLQTAIIAYNAAKTASVKVGS